LTTVLCLGVGTQLQEQLGQRRLVCAERRGREARFGDGYFVVEMRTEPNCHHDKGRVNRVIILLRAPVSRKMVIDVIYLLTSSLSVVICVPRRSLRHSRVSTADARWTSNVLTRWVHLTSDHPLHHTCNRRGWNIVTI